MTLRAAAHRGRPARGLRETTVGGPRRAPMAAGAARPSVGRVTFTPTVPSAWPGPPGTLQTVETHTARVHLTADRAYKVRKPVRYPFVDYTDPEMRRRAAQAEVELNATLAPGTYLAVRPLIAGADGAPVLGGPGDEAQALDHVVEMRRFAERDTLAARVAADRLDEAMLARLGARLAAFHRSAERAPGGGASMRWPGWTATARS